MVTVTADSVGVPGFAGAIVSEPVQARANARVATSVLAGAFLIEPDIWRSLRRYVRRLGRRGTRNSRAVAPELCVPVFRRVCRCRVPQIRGAADVRANISRHQ